MTIDDYLFPAGDDHAKVPMSSYIVDNTTYSSAKLRVLGFNQPIAKKFQGNPFPKKSDRLSAYQPSLRFARK